jgi:EH domain-containing protein 1
MNKKKLQLEIQHRVEGKLFPLLEEYLLDPGELAAVIKWKPIVLLLGNYSSGKSTLINELLGDDVQLTGQAPTDDSFTVITAPGADEKLGIITGASLVNDDQLPFLRLKAYGEQLSSHFQMKLLDMPVLENLAIIDTPGMLDSVTEKGRGYDFPKVVGEFASLADLIVLMFDPHKAGTIKETYTTIRSTLPETAGEDRVVYVMSRIDECDNLGDLIRSYGTLCWNLSQMTGRKDIPRIFLTFSPTVRRTTKALEAWVDERNQLKERILAAPENKIGHILHLVDRKLHELKLITEAMVTFAREGRRLLRRMVKRTAIVSIGVFLFVDLFLRLVAGAPDAAFLLTLATGNVAIGKLVVPFLAALSCWVVSAIWFTKWQLPHYFRACRGDVERMVLISTPYQEDIWQRVRGNVIRLISHPGLSIRSLYYPHQKNLEKVNRFLREDLKKYFSRNRLLVPDSDNGEGGTDPSGS